jgi:hypothetical protein
MYVFILFLTAGFTRHFCFPNLCFSSYILVTFVYMEFCIVYNFLHMLQIVHKYDIYCDFILIKAIRLPQTVRQMWCVDCCGLVWHSEMWCVDCCGLVWHSQMWCVDCCGLVGHKWQNFGMIGIWFVWVITKFYVLLWYSVLVVQKISEPVDFNRPIHLLLFIICTINVTKINILIHNLVAYCFKHRCVITVNQYMMFITFNEWVNQPPQITYFTVHKTHFFPLKMT